MAAGDLTTLTNVRQFLQKSAGDTGQDAVTSALITRASAAFKNYTDREFTPTTAATRTFEFEQSAYPYWLDLAPYDLRTATTVTLDPDVGAYTLAAIEYRLYPLPNPDGVYQGIRLQPLSYGQGRWRYRQLSILGDWGFASVPADIEDACIKTVAVWLRRDVAAFDQTANEGVWIRPQELPSAVTATLDRYRRMSFG